MSKHELASAMEPAVDVLLLHGFLGRGDDWSEITESLGLNFRILAPDLPGHGSALDLRPSAYTMDGAADRLVSLLDDQNIQKTTLVGYSMGGRLGLHLTLRYPERFQKLILLSASPGLQTEEERIERRELDLRRAKKIDDDLHDFLERWYRMPLFQTMDSETRDLLVAKRSLNRPADLKKALEGMGTGAQPSHWEHLHQIRVPSWAVVGARDAKFMVIAQQMAGASEFEAIVVPDAGHALLQERPREMATLIGELASV